MPSLASGASPKMMLSWIPFCSDILRVASHEMFLSLWPFPAKVCMPVKIDRIKVSVMVRRRIRLCKFFLLGVWDMFTTIFSVLCLVGLVVLSRLLFSYCQNGVVYYWVRCG